ncbi:LicD family protein [Sphingobacterium sp. R2]|uniref:LicD family protein n=1 Tax=Sphingobacterium sp. R2 TaxID=3112958 RepID=UPI00345CF26C
MKRIDAPLFVHLSFMALTFYALLTDGDCLRYFTKNLNFNLIIFGLQVAALIYAGYLQAQRNRKIFSIFWPALVGLITLISCVLITGNYQFNTNINITILWLIPEAYYIAYDVLIAHLIKEMPLPLNINWQFQAKCIYIILSAMPIAFSRFGFYWGTSSYIISRKSIKELIENCSEIRWPLAEQLLELGISRKIKMIAVDTDWTMFADRKAPSYLARKKSMIEYIESYSAWEKDEINEVREILCYLSETAASLDVKIFLHAGTLLGSIRHSGKIMPWDDDIDLMVRNEDLTILIPAIRKDNIYNVTEWTWSKTGKTYYKIWKEGGYKTEGYEYTFPFVDIWWTEEIGNKIHTNDGYVFEKKSYFPLQPIEFENAKFYHPAVATDILDTMYKGWRNEIKIFSWSHRFKKHNVKQISVPITTDKKGRFTNYK